MFNKMDTRWLHIALVVIFIASISHAEMYDSLEHNDNNWTNEKSNKRLTTYEAIDKLKWEYAIIMSGVFYTGITKWNWGSSNSFKFNSEGWFQMDTGSAGADKLGHMYSSYLINEFFNKRLLGKSDDVLGAGLYSALFSGSVMLLIEVWDGYSVDHGFSYEDLLFNSLGIGVSFLKNTVAGMDDKIDLRVEYHPTQEYRDHPITDYSGYWYSAVLRAGGFEGLQSTPLKYFELLVGYHAEGFKENEAYYYDEMRTEVYMGIGLNLTELLFKPLKRYTDSSLVDYPDTFFRYYQTQYTYISTSAHERTAPY